MQTQTATALLGFAPAGPVMWDPERDGPLVIYGSLGAGKTTLATNLIASLSREVDVKFLTVNQQLPGALERLPNVTLSSTHSQHVSVLGLLFRDVQDRWTVRRQPEFSAGEALRPIVVIVDDVVQLERSAYPHQVSPVQYLMDNLLEEPGYPEVYFVLTSTMPLGGLPLRHSHVRLNTPNRPGALHRPTPGTGLYFAHDTPPAHFIYSATVPHEATA